MASRAWAWLVVWACLVGGALASCTFSHRNLLARQPLLLRPGGSRDARGFVHVDASANVVLKTGEEIELACPGTNNYLQGSNVLPLPNITVACQSSYTFTADGISISLNQVECALEPLHEARVTGDARRCAPRLSHVEVGFALAGGFLPLYEVCLDADALAPAATRHYVVAAYVQSTQVQSFTVQLGSTNANKYITYNNYLQYNLLTPLEDFVYGPQRMAVSFYLNSFASGFWRSLESSVREVARSEGDLLVQTSAVGVAQLPDAEGRPTPTYLHATAAGARLMPLPQFLVKSVENARGEQVVFEVCEDVCARLRWLPWRRVPPASRSVLCCRAGDPLLRRLLPTPFAHDDALARSLAHGGGDAPLLEGGADAAESTPSN
ncbi:Uncharacterized protein GBIM_11350 [Gryllus bimaculatus]|nr:Uncharacterized protein GBIM_11350 [Gryllus bimaculatus]